MKMTFKKGDFVAVLDDNLEGIIVDVSNNEAVLETKDGFVLSYKFSELVKIENAELDFSFNKSKILNEKEVKKPNFINNEKKSRKEQPVPEFDLHIEKLVKNHKIMNNFDILTIQLETAKRHIDFAIKNRIPKIILIHGVGEGVLKSELEFLFGRYDDVAFQDASYQKYGVGATEIYFKQNKN